MLLIYIFVNGKWESYEFIKWQDLTYRVWEELFNDINEYMNKCGSKDFISYVGLGRLINDLVHYRSVHVGNFAAYYIDLPEEPTCLQKLKNTVHLNL